MLEPDVNQLGMFEDGINLAIWVIGMIIYAVILYKHYKLSSEERENTSSPKIYWGMFIFCLAQVGVHYVIFRGYV